ncbi:MAG: hypothetical protein A2139_00630 [Desulfobacca sp. RBG_16_60_12]|nr:MAG: hypothetical protein A2139_00630 [Desulfobacca sp. RBG_16_60_12]
MFCLLPILDELFVHIFTLLYPKYHLSAKYVKIFLGWRLSGSVLVDPLAAVGLSGEISGQIYLE